MQQALETSEVERTIVRGFCEALTETLSAACASSWQVNLAEQASGAVPDTNSGVWFRCGFDGPCAGDALLAFPTDVLWKLSVNDLPEDESEARKARIAKLLSGLQEGLARIASGTAFGTDAAATTSLRVEGLDGPSLANEQVVELSVQRGPDTPDERMTMHLCLGRKLLAALQAASVEAFVFPNAASADAANLDLVMDVELNVTLRFGQRQLALREVLELTSGSVVELDRQVDEWVELVLDGRVVARGEAVIIDGNYGMRVTQLVQHFIP